ncbi:MAG TPA: hydroxymethylglutaryl-CoA reductase, degradative [Saprospiraceae bacterium]|nr:hydroxymethylglutaryl-CoA reductase, degradative [Saprospiraceae bacterium]
MHKRTVSGFSKKNKSEKIDWLAEHYFSDNGQLKEEWQSFEHSDSDLQKVFDAFSENTVANYYMPYGVAPNFMIDGKVYAVPMVIEESSVVAAAASAAKFWLSRGGFQTEVRSTVKLGQLHFTWSGPSEKLQAIFSEIEAELCQDAKPITANMEQRGGGIIGMELIDFTAEEAGYYQLRVRFETCDSMGANFINSVLESFGDSLRRLGDTHQALRDYPLEIVMAILSNYTPECIVRAQVSCPVDELEGACQDMDGAAFAEKFRKAVRIAEIDPYRATTHNKGIFNGVDAVVLATGNDFRAIEACGHTHAAADGQYRSLSHCTVEDGVFTFWLDLPLAVGTVGGLTKLHPLARRSLELLDQPSAAELMSIIAATGLAQNFAAVRSLVTTGIQKGHMKMHLMNILNFLGATDAEIKVTQDHFTDQIVSFNAVRAYLQTIRSGSIKTI